MKSLFELFQEMNDEALGTGLMTTKEYIALREAQNLLYAGELNSVEHEAQTTQAHVL